jgi:DNA-binding CsgD family transcriptional regulator
MKPPPSRKPRNFYLERTAPVFTFSKGMFPPALLPRALAIKKSRTSRNWRFTVKQLPTEIRRATIGHLLQLARKVRHLRDDGRTFKQIGKRLDISPFDARILAYTTSTLHLRDGTPRATDEHIAKLYVVDNMSIRQIAERTREHPSQVQRALDREQVPRRPRGGRAASTRPEADPRLEKILALRGTRRWFSLEQIGARLGVSRETVRKILRKAGHPGRQMTSQG